MSRYDQAKADYERMRELMSDDGRLSQIYDFTGGFVFEEKGMELMKRPTKAHAAEIYVDMIIYGFQAGWSSATSEDRVMPDIDNPEIAEIYERYM